MGKVRDLTGQRFGRMVAISYLGTEKYYSVWLCECDCGNSVKVRAHNLLSGNSKSCGCLALELKRYNVKDILGKQIGLLRVLRESGNPFHEDIKQRYLYECQCDCGNVVTVQASLLRSGHVKSCGCLKRRRVDILGKEFGNLKVIGRSDIYVTKSKTYPWICKCSCGNVILATYHSLVKGITVSCGCALGENEIIKIGKDPIRKRLYGIWKGLRRRCHNPDNVSYKNYGAIGISVSDEWKSFERFCLDMGNPPSSKHQIDRIDNTVGYFKENCRWVVSSQNNRNRRSNRVITMDGITKCVSDWAEDWGLNMHTLLYRINAGWPNEKLSKPKHSRI